jgi:hypothetical protein
MVITPTVTTAALAGAFSAGSWPLLWPLFTDPSGSASMWLVIGMLVFVALPAHAFVVGFGRSPTQTGRSIDVALLKRIGAWLLAACVTAGAMALYRASA